LSSHPQHVEDLRLPALGLPLPSGCPRNSTSGPAVKQAEAPPWTAVTSLVAWSGTGSRSVAEPGVGGGEQTADPSLATIRSSNVTDDDCCYYVVRQGGKRCPFVLSSSIRPHPPL
jgi:hypothetical protein